MRFESLTQGGLSVIEYEARFYELSRHLMTIVPDEAERVHWFVRGFTFSIKSYVFKAAREGDSFQSIVSTAKEAELMVLEEFGEPKRACSSGHISSSLFEGRCSHRGSSSFQHRGPIHASMLAIENGQSARRSYVSSQGGHGSSSGSQQQLSVPRSCYTCGDPSHMMRQCPLQTHSRPHRSYSATPSRDPTPPARVEAELTLVEVAGLLVGGTPTLQGGGRGSTHATGGRDGQCYAFLGRPEAENSDAVITGVN